MDFFLFIVLLGCVSVQAMPWTRRNMPQQNQLVVAVPNIIPMSDFAQGTSERSTYDRTTLEVRNAVQRYGRQPVWTIRFCDKFSGLLGDVHYANELLRQQYGCGKELEELDRELIGFLKLKYADSRIICSRDECSKTIFVHTICHRSNVYNAPNTFVAAHTNCCRE